MACHPISVTGTGLGVPRGWLGTQLFLMQKGRLSWLQHLLTPAPTRAELVDLTGWSRPLSPVLFGSPFGIHPWLENVLPKQGGLIFTEGCVEAPQPCQNCSEHTRSYPEGPSGQMLSPPCLPSLVHKRPPSHTSQYRQTGPLLWTSLVEWGGHPGDIDVHLGAT